MCHTLLQTSAQRQACLNVLPRCSLSYAKITIFETKSKETHLFFYLFSFQYIFRKLNAHDLLIIDDFGMK